MADDGSNQRGDSGRLHSITNNNDGTVTIVYKNMLAEQRFKNNQSMGSVCKPFDIGQTVYIYNSEGVVLCDGPAISTSSQGKIETCTVEGRECSYQLYTVTVAESSIKNWNALNHADGTPYDLNDNHYLKNEKIMVDNLGQNCADFTFDNVLIQNVRSRGILVKTTGVTIKNCTFRNLAQTAVKLSNEVYWGESTVPRETRIIDCLFDNVGYDGKHYDHVYNAPISVYIELGGEFFNENGMCCRDIIIDGCKFINNDQRYAIHVQNAQEITIRNCDFGNVTGGLSGYAISLDKAMNVSIYGNTYNNNTPIKATETKNVTDQNGNLIIADTAQ